MIARKDKENNYIGSSYVGPILYVKHHENGEILLFNVKTNTIATE